jgi:hypothetical protein
MPGKKLIRLWDSVGLGLIILGPSGVVYSNQAGGTCCLQQKDEGFFVPLHDEVRGQERMLLDYFLQPEAPSAAPEGFDAKTADFIDEVLGMSHTTRFLKVDRTKLKDSVKAWVYVEVGDQPDEPPVTFDGNIGTTASGEIWVTSDYAELPIPPYNYLIYGFGACKGVLTWCNSD